ncbi:coiled-coil domain-containing protein 183 isoform X2 [Sorex fumeus]|uniref:coiled-coil domain-containing protein 183 isoform X2 n=1 Tax=Sorex fumeus TaxID=62283 RepID=UPI0024AE7F49|nr:coiled-coil domain-containing protein 183 isoform X2 [Sorex fumeus]
MEVNQLSNTEEQIQELKTITRLQEQCRALQLQSVKENTERNLSTLAALHGDVRRQALEWALTQKSDQRIVSKACGKNLPLKLALSHSTVEVVREKLCKLVLERVNAHNALLHLARRRGRTLERLRRELARARGYGPASREAQRQLQAIRQLENSIEKKLTLIAATQHVRLLYERLREHLRRMLCGYPKLLDRLQSKVTDYCLELTDMTAMSQEAIKITDGVKRNMKKMETTFMEERRAREERLSQQKRVNDKIRARDVSEKFRRQDRHFASSPLSASSPRVKSREPSRVDSQYQNSVRKLVEQVKSSVQCSHLWDITGRFQAQRHTEENLEVQMRECTERQAQLQALGQQLELEEMALKFRQAPSLVSSKSAEGRIQVRLRDEQERLQLAHASMVKRQQLLLTMEMGVNNLYFRLIGATLPEAQKAVLPPKPLGMFDKLAYCEERLVQLAKRTQMLTKTEEISAKVRDALESSTLKERLNYRIRFKELEDEEDVIETLFSEADQSYVPSRAEIKNQAQELISGRLRGSKKRR